MILQTTTETIKNLTNEIIELKENIKINLDLKNKNENEIRKIDLFLDPIIEKNISENQNKKDSPIENPSPGNKVEIILNEKKEFEVNNKKEILQNKKKEIGFFTRLIAPIFLTDNEINNLENTQN